MNVSDNDIEMIDRYLADDLDPSEKELFERRLSENSLLRSHLGVVKQAIEGIQANADRDRIRNLHRTYATQETTRQRFRYISGIAASLLILAVSTFLVLRNQAHKAEAYRAYFTPYPSPIHVRGATRNDHPEAIKFYDRQQFEAAIQAFNRVPVDRRTNEMKFYHAVSFLGNGQPAGALPILEELQSDPESYAEPVRWYLALSYLQLDQDEQAKTLLLQIDQGEFEYDRAQEILSRLR
ncbi:MAG TPA: tetratricopeptide repeat protein [Chryseosolibacter sp.]|nr:tetratricopeptide repeat protein [Chryseosolibacter sp.]